MDGHTPPEPGQVLEFRHLGLSNEQWEAEMRRTLFATGGPPSIVEAVLAEVMPILRQANDWAPICCPDVPPEAFPALVRGVNLILAETHRRNAHLMLELVRLAIECCCRRAGLTPPDGVVAAPPPARPSLEIIAGGKED